MNIEIIFRYLLGNIWYLTNYKYINNNLFEISLYYIFLKLFINQYVVIKFGSLSGGFVINKLFTYKTLL